MVEQNHGAGVRLLADLAGVTPDELRSDPKALAKGLQALGDEAVEIIRNRSSDDPAVRAASDERWRELRERVDEGPTPGEVLRERIRSVLSDVRRALEDEREVADEPVEPGSGL